MMRVFAATRRNAALLAAGGALAQLGGCGPFDIGRYVARLNPCGTLLNCDPVVYEFARSGIDSPGVVPDKDPFCTYPPYCPQTVDPIFGGVLP